LDQFLEHLLDVGIRKIIRIGGQSRSERLDTYNVRNVTLKFGKTKSENYSAAQEYKLLNNLDNKMQSSLASLRRLRQGLPSVEPTLKRFLQRRHPGIFSQFYSVDEDFVVIGSPISNWLRQGSRPITGSVAQARADELVETASRDVYSLAPAERSAILQHWTEKLREEQTEMLVDSIASRDYARARLDAIHDEVRRCALLSAQIVDVTTTGLARDVSLIRRLRSKVVLCEEVAEVLEAHLLSALMPGV
jgi:hypothetical protein